MKTRTAPSSAWTKKTQVTPVALIAAVQVLAGCMEGPKFFTSSNAYLSDQRAATETTDGIETLIVPIREEGGKAIAAISALSDKTQLIQASANSLISGSKVEFPPGSIAVATEITLSAGAAIATTESLRQLDLGTKVTSAAPAVTISSSVPMDTVQPFTVALPIPDSSTLHLADPLDNLVVFYRVGKVSLNGDFEGIFTRDQIEIANGYARVKTRFFGTYQAIITATKVVKAVEVAAAPPPPAEPTPPPPEPKGRFYYVRGFAAATFGENALEKGGLQGWVHALAPAKVGQGQTLSHGVVSRGAK